MDCSVLDWTVHKPRWKQSYQKQILFLTIILKTIISVCWCALISPSQNCSPKFGVQHPIKTAVNSNKTEEMHAFLWIFLCDDQVLWVCTQISTRIWTHTNRFLSDLPHHQLPVNSSIIFHTQTFKFCHQNTFHRRESSQTRTMYTHCCAGTRASGIQMNQHHHHHHHVFDVTR